MADTRPIGMSDLDEASIRAWLAGNQGWGWIPGKPDPSTAALIMARSLLSIIDAERAAHDARVSELLDANTREVERRRLAEAKRDRALALSKTLADRLTEEFLLADDEEYDQTGAVQRAIAKTIEAVEQSDARPQP